MTNLKYYFFIICSLLIWSSYSLILKKIEVNPLVFTFFTIIIGWFFLNIYIKIKNIKIHISNKNKIYILILTIFMIINSVTFFFAYQLTSIPNAIFSHYLAPVFVSLLVPVMIKEHIEKITIISLILAIIGMYFIFFPDGFKMNLSHNDLLGIFMGIVSAICYALLIIGSKYIIKGITPIGLLFYQGIFTMVFAIISIPFLKENIIINFKTILIFIGIGFLHSFFAPILYLESLKHIKAQFAGLLGYTEVIGSILLGIIFLKEIPSFTILLGGILIVISGGMVILNAR